MLTNKFTTAPYIAIVTNNCYGNYTSAYVLLGKV